MSLSFKEVAEIIKIIDASECEELSLELDGIRLNVRRSSASGAVVARQEEIARTAGTSSSTTSTSTQVIATAEGAPASFTSGGQEPALIAGDSPIRSPSVGTFYRGPGPDSPPFVETGSKIAAGDSLCIIEVMKLFTTIESPVSGTVKSILPNNAEGVEFDQLLFVIAIE